MLSYKGEVLVMLSLIVLTSSIILLTFSLSLDTRLHCFLNSKELHLLLPLELCDEDAPFYDLTYLESITPLNMEYPYHKKFRTSNSYLHCRILEKYNIIPCMALFTSLACTTQGSSGSTRQLQSYPTYCLFPNLIVSIVKKHCCSRFDTSKITMKFGTKKQKVFSTH